MPISIDHDYFSILYRTAPRARRAWRACLNNVVCVMLQVPARAVYGDPQEPRASAQQFHPGQLDGRLRLQQPGQGLLHLPRPHLDLPTGKL